MEINHSIPVELRKLAKYEVIAEVTFRNSINGVSTILYIPIGSLKKDTMEDQVLAISIMVKTLVVSAWFNNVSQLSLYMKISPECFRYIQESEVVDFIDESWISVPVPRDQIPCHWKTDTQKIVLQKCETYLFETV